MKTWGSVGFPPHTTPDRNNRKIHYLINRGSELGDVEKGRKGSPGEKRGGGTWGGHPAAAFVQMGLVGWFGVFLNGGSRVRMRCLQVS